MIIHILKRNRDYYSFYNQTSTAWRTRNYENFAIDNIKEGKDSNGNKKENSASDQIYCHANHNNQSGDCKFCLRNLSRCYSEGDASVILNASSLLASSQSDSNNLEKIIPPHRQTSGDISSNNNDKFLHNSDKLSANITGEAMKHQFAAFQYFLFIKIKCTS